MQEKLTGALTDQDDGGVIDAFGAPLPEGDHLPVLLRVKPWPVMTGREGGYISDEQVAT